MARPEGDIWHEVSVVVDMIGHKTERLVDMHLRVRCQSPIDQLAYRVVISLKLAQCDAMVLLLQLLEVSFQVSFYHSFKELGLLTHRARIALLKDVRLERQLAKSNEELEGDQTLRQTHAILNVHSLDQIHKHGGVHTINGHRRLTLDHRIIAPTCQRGSSLFLQ